LLSAYLLGFLPWVSGTRVTRTFVSPKTWV